MLQPLKLYTQSKNKQWQMLQSGSNSRGSAGDMELRLAAWTEKVESDAAVSTTDGAVARCCVPGCQHKDRADVAKATEVSTSVSLSPLFLLALWKAARRGCAHNLPRRRISLTEFISIKCDSYFFLSYLKLTCKCVHLSTTSICWATNT